MSTGREEERQASAALAETLFRDVNERVREISEGFSVAEPVDEWVCECADSGCTEAIALPAPEYERVRSHRTRFFVKPEHVDPEIEAVVEKHDGYWIVEKTGPAAEVAAESDPRADDR
ncbi:MAG: hypothetical protein ICV64_00560 [Thermoleophilia bacterium]|nr:hypothetical protein [Thermoleophilia bacterium]